MFYAFLTEINILPCYCDLLQSAALGGAGGLNVLCSQQAEDKIKTLLEVSCYHVKDEIKCLLSSRECQKIQASRLWGCRVSTSSSHIEGKRSGAVC